jgi:hypothetical protein
MLNLIPLVHAADQTVDIGGEVSKGGFFGYTCIGSLISNAASVAFILAAIATFALLVAGGFSWLTSGGDKTKIEGAQKSITNALIGFAIIAASWAIYNLVLSFFGIDLSKLCTANPV